MPDPATLPVAVLYNCDFDSEDPAQRDRADVAQAAQDVSQALSADLGLSVRTHAINGDADAVVAQLRREPPALVFNLTESLGGDARHEILVPALLDFYGVPYTGSGPLTLGLALRKDRCKDVLRARGVSTPAAVVVGDAAELDGLDLRFPIIVKPAHEDGSIGISASSVVHDLDALRARVREAIASLRQPMLCEQYVEGREIYASILGNAPREVLPLYEIDFRTLPAALPRIVTYRGKWDVSSDECLGTKPVPCVDLAPDVAARVRAVAACAADALEIRDYGRIDIRLDRDGVPYVIDVNPNCDLSSTAGFARAAAAAGLSYAQLVRRVCHLTLARAAGAAAA
ncbi:MAG TPA: D-alanine--D-alanine ligase [Polyangia bacterium]|jgi:D-alanine-D-alanine ligase